MFGVGMGGGEGVGVLPSNWGCLWGLSLKNFEISGSEKCILVDPGDGFAIDNGESKNPLRSDTGSRPPNPPPGSATVLGHGIVFYLLSSS